MTQPLFQIDGLRVDFPGVVAVDGLSLQLNAGDVCGLIGPNGSGKTTTLRAVAGLQTPTRGRVRIAGHDPQRGEADFKRMIGFMPDFAPVYDRLRAREFLDHFARAQDLADPNRRVRECLQLGWLTEKSEARCRELSRGMKQRLILAKTLLHDPTVLLLDEPASGIDPIGRIELRRLIQRLGAAGKAVIVSSHVLSEMDQFCNRVAIMEEGRLVRFGAIDEPTGAGEVRRIRVRWREPHEAVRRLLDAHEAVRQLEQVDEHTAEFVFAGDDRQIDDLLAALVNEGVRIVEWRPMAANLEQILLESGARKVT